MKRKTKIILTILSAAILLNIVLNAFGNALITEHYTVNSDKLTAPVRIVFITDLHNCTYGGADQSGILTAIHTEHPDIVLFGGDMIDMMGGTDSALTLMKAVRNEYPCAYSAGNHEVVRKDYKTFFSAVSSLGIPVLQGSYTDIEVNSQQIRVAGIIDVHNSPDLFTDCCKSAGPEKYNVLLVHQPEQLDAVIDECAAQNTRFDLVLSGHAHGGPWRIPGLADQGLFAPDQGIFPAFTGGQREQDGTVQIVSRGLAKPLRMILIPRIFNRPEISSAEIVPAVSGDTPQQ